MAKLVIELSPTLTGKVLADFTWDFCKKISDDSAVSTAGCALTEYGNGVYSLSNPNVTADTYFRLHLTADSTQYATGRFALCDDNTALQTSLASVPTTDNTAAIAAVKAKTDNLPASPAAVGSAMTLSGDFTATMKTSLNAATPTVTLATVQPNYAPSKAGDAMTLTGAYDAAKITPDNISIGSILTMMNSGIYGLAALKTAVASIPTNPLLASAYTAPGNADISAIRSAVENVIYGLAAIKTGLSSVTATVDLTSVTTRLDTIMETPDPLAVVIEGSDPPMTRAEAIDNLYVPGYVGPVIAIPANADPDVQFVHFYGKKGDRTASSARKVSAVPTPGQVQDQNLIDKERLTATLNDDGYSHLTLICGIEYKILASWWGDSITITVTADANRSFAAYVQDLLDGAVPVAEPEGVMIGEVE